MTLINRLAPRSLSARRWLRSLLGRKPDTIRKQPARRFSFLPAMETLEDRTVPSTVDLFYAPSSQVTFKFQSESAGYNNELGVYLVDDETGAVGGVTPGSTGYAQAVLNLTANTQRWVLFNGGTDAVGTTKTLTLSPNEHYAFYLVQDDTTANWSANNPDNTFTSPWQSGEAPHVWFSLAASNPDSQTDHFLKSSIQQNVTQLEIEDYDYGNTTKSGSVVGGEPDYNDMVITVTAAPPVKVPGGCDCPPTGSMVAIQAMLGAIAGSFSSGPVRYADGTVKLVWNDLYSTGFGTPWGQTRNWTNAAGYSSAGTNGSGMVNTETPFIMQADGTSNMIAVITSGTDAEYFDLSGGVYNPRFFSQNKLTYDGGTDTFTLIDTAGNKITFNGFGTSLPSWQRGSFQSWTDSAGNVTQVTSRDTSGVPLPEMLASLAA